MLSGVVPCFEPSRLVPKDLEAIAVSRSSYWTPAFAHSVTLDHTHQDTSSSTPVMDGWVRCVVGVLR